MMKKLLLAGNLAFGALVASPLGAFAQDTSTINIAQPDTVTITNIGSLISALVALIFIVAAIIFFFLLVLGGIQWMLSGGDKAATEAARGRITAAFIGLLIVFTAWAITKLMEMFLGISILGGAVKIPTPKDFGQ